MAILRFFLTFTLLTAALPIAAPAFAQAPARTPLQQASPIVDTLAARVNKLLRDVEAAGADGPKVRGLTEKYKQDNERLEAQLTALKGQMSPAEAGELEVYTQLKMGRAPDKLKAALEKAAKDAAEAAAKVGPATVAKYRETIGTFEEEGHALVKRVRDAGNDAGKREKAWQALLAWDTKRHALAQAIRKDPNIVEPKVLTDEADEALQPFATHATRLYRLYAQPLCTDLQKELGAAEARAAKVVEAATAAESATGGKRAMAITHVNELKAAALEVGNADLTLDEQDEVRDTVTEILLPALKKLSTKKR